MNKIIINERGNLFVKRGIVMKPQCCPYHKDKYCGDWCPKLNIGTSVVACGTYLEGPVEDLRKNAKDDIKDVKVFTRYGWKNQYDLNTGDELLGSNGKYYKCIDMKGR